MCHSIMNLLQGGIIGPLLIYAAARPNPDMLRTLGVITIIYHLYQLYIKGDLIDLSENPVLELGPIYAPPPAQGVRVARSRSGFGPGRSSPSF